MRKALGVMAINCFRKVLDMRNRLKIWLLPLAVCVLLTAGCNRDRCKLLLIASPMAYGMVEGGGEYRIGTEVTIRALPDEGYRFVKWSDNNTQNPRVLVLSGNMSLTAYFAEQSAPGPGPEPGGEPNRNMAVTFDGTTWYGCGVLMFDMEVGYPMVQLQVLRSDEDLTQPIAGFNLPPQTGSYTSHGDTVYSCFYLEHGEADMVSYGGESYPRWIALNRDGQLYCTGSVSALDLNACTVSMTLQATMLNMYNVANGLDEELRTLTVALNGVRFVQA